MVFDDTNMCWPYQAELRSAKLGVVFVVIMKYLSHLFETALEMGAKIFVIIREPWKC